MFAFTWSDWVSSFSWNSIGANHWIVISIGLLFLAMQLYLCLRFWYRMRRHHREINKLLNDLAEGGDGRDIEAYARDIPWLRWVDTNFPRDSATPGSYTRDDVLKELDTQIASNRQYLLLQRAGVMAPLLGVVLTVIGFFMLEVPERAEQSLSDILYTITPLVAGVGTGGALALINQWLLHFAGNKVEAVRMSARAWFDAAIWSRVGLDVQAATVKAITAMERMSKSVAQAAEQHNENTKGLRKGIHAIQQASESFRQTHQSFGDELRAMPPMLGELTAAAKSAVQTLGALIPVGERAVLGMDTSVAAFHAAVQDNFAEAAKTHRSTIESLADAITRISESTQHLKVGSTDLQETVNAHTNAFKGLNRSLQQQVLPAHEGFLAAMSHFNGRAEGLLDRLDALHGQITESIERIASLAPELNKAIGTFSATATSFADAVQHKFTPAADEQQQTTERLATSFVKLEQAALGLADTETVAHGLANLQARLSEELGASQEILRQSVEVLSETASEMNQSFTGELVPSHRSMHQAAMSFVESTKQLRQFFEQGLDPTTQRLTQLDDTLGRLGQTVEAIREFAGVRQEIERLAGALAQAAAVTEAINQLPQQIRNVLEEVARTHQEQIAANSSGGWTALFRRRK
jgi:ABC-type transporter Mla subunit MlaD